MRPILLAMLAALLPAQAPPTTGTISVRGANGETVTYEYTLRPLTALVSLDCGLKVLEPGQTMSCIATLNQSAPRGGYQATVVLMPGHTGPATLTIPEGAVSIPFAVRRDGPTPPIAYADPPRVIQATGYPGKVSEWGFVVETIDPWAVALYAPKK